MFPVLLYQSIIIIIPAKNEAATVGQVIAEIKAYFKGNIVVVDDASTDDTAKIAAKAGAQVISLPLSLGAWGAIQTGLRYALKTGHHTAITMDADGQHEAQSIPILLNYITNENCDVVIGAYPQRGSFLRKSAWFLFRQLSGISLEDLTSGLRVYNHHAIALLASSEATLLEYQDLGVLMLLRQAGLQIEEAPILMRPRSVGHSRIFNSWFSVSKYMLYTGILCLAQMRRRKKIKCHTKSPLQS